MQNHILNTLNAGLVKESGFKTNNRMKKPSAAYQLTAQGFDWCKAQNQSGLKQVKTAQSLLVPVNVLKLLVPRVNEYGRRVA